jgi:hypothetical protein
MSSKASVIGALLRCGQSTVPSVELLEHRQGSFQIYGAFRDTANGRVEFEEKAGILACAGSERLDRLE